MPGKTYRILGILLIICTQQAIAHRDDYLNETVVYLTLQKSEVETEYWFDYGWYTNSNTNNDFYRHNAAVEWGITDKWMTDGRITFISEQGKPTNFESGRLETRYRFANEGTHPVDIATSFEINAERNSDGSHTVGLEPRLIISKDFVEKLNLTLNLSAEIPVKNQSAEFLSAFGFRYNWTHLIRLGSEFQYNFKENTGIVIPQLWFTFNQDITFKTGYAYSVNQESNNFIRAALEVEF